MAAAFRPGVYFFHGVFHGFWFCFVFAFVLAFVLFIKRQRFSASGGICVNQIRHVLKTKSPQVFHAVNTWVRANRKPDVYCNVYNAKSKVLDGVPTPG